MNISLLSSECLGSLRWKPCPERPSDQDCLNTAKTNLPESVDARFLHLIFHGQGITISNDKPCSPSQTHSMCFEPGKSTCLSNGLCLWLDDFSIDRGSCTDSNWNAPECLTICKCKALSPQVGKFIYWSNQANYFAVPSNGHADLTPW